MTDQPSSAAGTAFAGPRQLRRLLDAVISLASDLDLPVLLRHLVEAGRELIGARYAALGVLDPQRTYLAEFLTAGIDDAGRATIGELPKGHGLLGVLIHRPQPLRLPDLTEHPDRFGFPPNHPPMSSFLGVPLYVHGEVFGNLYFTEKLDSEVFTDIDEELAVALAGAAAISIENARLHTRTQELTLLTERERFGRDLHDTVIQRVFATGLAMHTTARMVTDPEVQSRIVGHIDELDQIVRELRTAIFQLEVRRASGGGVREQILSVVADSARSIGFDPVVHFDGPIDAVTTDDAGTNLVAVLREALSNVARHAHATNVDVSVSATTRAVVLEVRDNGVGLADGRRTGDGLGNIADRAQQLGGSSLIGPAPDRGTLLRWSVPL